jgi:hypothetical protein
VTPRLNARIRSDFAADDAALVVDELPELELPLIDGHGSTGATSPWPPGSATSTAAQLDVELGADCDDG